MRRPNQHTNASPQWCDPTLPERPAGAALTVDPAYPPPTTSQAPFCDWPSGVQMASYPDACGAFAPNLPRLSNAGVMQARVQARQRMMASASMPMPLSGCPQFWEPCGSYMGKQRCCPSGVGTTDPRWVSPKRPHWPNPEPRFARTTRALQRVLGGRSW